MDTVYVVTGTTGEYSDHREWAVKAFKTKRAAEAFVLAVTQEAARALGIAIPEKIPDGHIGGESSVERGLNKLDPEMHVDYTGVRYYYDAVPFVDK